MITQDDIDAFKEFNPEKLEETLKSRSSDLMYEFTPQKFYELLLLTRSLGERLSEAQIMSIAYETYISYRDEMNS